MVVTPVPLPAVDADRAYEPKWDGVRAVAYLSNGPQQPLSRAGQDLTGRYPELARSTTPSMPRSEGVLVMLPNGNTSRQRVTCNCSPG